MAGETQPAFVSVVITVRNEEAFIGDLLESLLAQERPFEVIVVDSNSKDDTRTVVTSFAAKHPEIRLLAHGGTRGESRNEGVRHAKGDWVVFIDGDCVASPQWLSTLRPFFDRYDAIAGKTVSIGPPHFAKLERVEVRHRGFDVTFPSSNLCYRRAVFLALGGFDSVFRTAEDIDLNYRAVDHGYRIGHAETAVVYARTRSSAFAFLKQAFWNGYGRKQLTLKHGRLWGSYRFRRMFREQLSLWGVLRLASATLGYLVGFVRESHREETPKQPTVPPTGEEKRA